MRLQIYNTPVASGQHQGTARRALHASHAAGNVRLAVFGRGMTRRDFVWTVAAATLVRLPAQTPPISDRHGEGVSVPVHLVTDARAKFTPEQLRRFSSTIWQEAVRDFNRCGIQFQISEGTGEIRRSPGGRPVFTGLRRGALNVVLTDHIPLDYAGLAGVTTLWQGYHLCVIALSHAHGHQIPFFSVNTCAHELLHALLQDIFVSRANWYQTGEREIRVDWYATRMWLFHDGAGVRQSAQAYLARLRSALAARTTQR